MAPTPAPTTRKPYKKRTKAPTPAPTTMKSYKPMSSY
jgi:hypothetical protein